MMDVACVLACLAVTVGAGSAVLRWLQPKCDEPLSAQFGWSFLMGTTLVAVLHHIPLALSGHLTHRNFAMTFGLCALLAGWTLCNWLWNRFGSSKITAGRIWVLDLPVPFRVATGLLVVFMAWFSASGPITTYDSRAIFGLKAKVLYDVGSVQNEDFQDLDRAHYHPHYPLMLPLVEAYLFWAQGSTHDDLIKWLGAAYLLALASVFVDQARRHESPRAAALWSLVLLATPMVLTPGEGGGLSGSADVPLAALLLAALVQVGRWLEDFDWRRAALAGLMLGAAVLMKQEGLIWIVAAGLAAALGCWRRSLPLRSHSLAVLAAGFLLGGCFLLGAVARQGLVESPYVRDYSMALRFDWLRQLWVRPLELVPAVARELVHTSAWSLAWPLLLLALWLKRPAPSGSIRLWRHTMVLVAAAYLCVFWITPYNLQFQVATALSRLMLHLYPLGLLVLVEQLAATGIGSQVAEIFRPGAAHSAAPAARRAA